MSDKNPAKPRGGFRSGGLDFEPWPISSCACEELQRLLLVDSGANHGAHVLLVVMEQREVQIR